MKKKTKTKSKRALSHLEYFNFSALEKNLGWSCWRNIQLYCNCENGKLSNGSLHLAESVVNIINQLISLYNSSTREIEHLNTILRAIIFLSFKCLCS